MWGEAPTQALWSGLGPESELTPWPTDRCEFAHQKTGLERADGSLYMRPRSSLRLNLKAAQTECTTLNQIAGSESTDTLLGPGDAGVPVRALQPCATGGEFHRSACHSP